MIYLISILAGGAVVCMLVGIYLLKSQKRLKDITMVFISSIKEKSEIYVGKTHAVLKAEELGIKLTAGNYIAIFTFSVITGLVMAAIFKSSLVILIGLIAGYMIPENVIEIAKINKLKRYLISSISGVELIAIQNMHTENMVTSISNALPNMREPFKGEMEEVLKDVNSGKYTLTEALDRMVVRTKSKHLRKVANSIKFADSIGGKGYKMLQRDANLLHKDRSVFERAEKRLKKTKTESYLSSLLQLLPFGIFYFSLPEMYNHLMSIWIGQMVLFYVLIKILIDFYITSKKTRTIFQ